jgi:hypothetical protein
LRKAAVLALSCALFAGCGSGGDGGGGGGGSDGGGSSSDSVAAQAAPYVHGATAGMFFVDWSAIREQQGGGDLNSKLSRQADIAPLRRANTPNMKKQLGFDTTESDWEAEIEGPGPPVGVLAFADDFDMSGVESALKRCGYKESSSGVDGGKLWTIGPVESCGGKKDDLGTSIPGPGFANIAVLAEKHVLVVGGSSGAVATAANGGDDTFGASVDDLDGTLDDVVAGYVGTGSFGCKALSGPPGGLTPEIEKALKERLGDLGPAYDVLLAGYVPKGKGYTGRVAMDFKDADTAKQGLDARKGAFDKAVSPTTNQPVSKLLVLDDAKTEDDAVVFSVSSRSGPMRLLTMVTRRDLPFASC